MITDSIESSSIKKMASNSLEPVEISLSENLQSAKSLEKLLLERSLIRKEMKILQLQEKLKQNAAKLLETNEKLDKYRSLWGLSSFKSFMKFLTSQDWFFLLLLSLHVTKPWLKVFPLEISSRV